MASTEPQQRSRPENGGIGCVGQDVSDLGKCGKRRVLARRREQDSHDVAIRWIRKLTPAGKLRSKKLLDSVLRGQDDRARLRLKRLDKDPPGPIPSATTRELSEQLECPLIGPEIGGGKLRASVDDRGKRDSREVVPLGDHLRPEENGPLGCLELPQDLGMAVPLGRCLGIESEQLQAG